MTKQQLIQLGLCLLGVAIGILGLSLMNVRDNIAALGGFVCVVGGAILFVLNLMPLMKYQDREGQEKSE